MMYVGHNFCKTKIMMTFSDGTQVKARVLDPNKQWRDIPADYKVSHLIFVSGSFI